MARTTTDEIIDVTARIAKMDTRAKIIIMKRLAVELAAKVKPTTPKAQEEKSGGTA